MLVRLELHRQHADRLALQIPLRIRLLPALASGWLLYVLAGVGGGPPIDVPRTAVFVIFALSALAALYDERWIFDLNEKKVTRRLGLLFAASETSFDLERFAAVVLFLAAPPAGGALLALEDTAGGRHTLERCRGARVGDLRAAGAQIADFCRLPLQERNGPA